MVEKSILRKLILGLGVLPMLLSFSVAQEFSFSIQTSTDLSSEGEYELLMGFSPDATDGYDEGIDQYAPPPPPPPAFDAAIGWDGDRYFTQILAGDGDLSEHVYDVPLQYGANNIINIDWNNSGWSALMDSVKLQDAFGGVMINVNMLEQTSYELTNPAFNLLKLKVYPKNVTQNPMAGFSFEPSEGFAPLSVNFTDQSEPGMGTISLWDWDFGDGGTSTEQNPTYVFTTAGEWNVKLVVENSQGISDSTTAVVTVNQPNPPTVDFTSDVTEGDTPLTVQYTDLSDQGDGELLSWEWDFGDGGSSTEQLPVYTYEESGEFTVSLTVTDIYTLSVTETKVNYISVFESLPPIADAGEDQSVVEGRLVTLDGSASVSVSGSPLTYLWIIPDGIVLSDNNAVTPTFIAPNVEEAEVFQFSLVVFDGAFYSESDTVIITINPNLPPIADAGDRQSVIENTIVQLDGSTSYDPELTVITYQWDSLNDIVLSNEFIANPSFIAPSVTDTTDYFFELIVTDEDGNVSLPDTVIITVLIYLPTADAGNSQVVEQGDLVELDGSNSSDPDGANLQYWWSAPTDDGVPIVEMDNISAVNPTFIAPDYDSERTLIFTLIVTNEEGGRHSDDVEISVLENKTPIAHAGNFRKTVQGRTIALNGGMSTDINHDQLLFSWESVDESLVINNPTVIKPVITIPTNLTERTEYEIVLTVTDEHGLISEPDTVIVTAVTETIQPPAAPNVFARVEHQKVVLTWDGISEDSNDPMTGYSDFEGYKVYRSLNSGKTWGTVIYDTYYDMDPTVPRDTVGWVPIAQFDLDEEQDRLHCLYENDYSCEEEEARGLNIMGLDPLRTEISLGANTGLSYSFIDTNVIDGVEYTYAVTAYDMGLPTYTKQFVDEDGDGTYREVEVWSPANPEHFIVNEETEPYWGANKSLECSKTDSSNFVTVIPGYYATNISFPDLDSIDTFIIANENNIGSGDRLFELVDVNALSTAMMRLEIEASPKPGSFESASTDNPKLYVYEITDSVFQEPASWVDVGSVSTLDSVSVDSLLSLPGAKSSNDIIYLPDYKLNAFPIMNQYEVGYQSNWTEFFDGVRLRYDNNISDWYKLEEITEGKYYAFIDAWETNMDSSNAFINVWLEYSSQEKFDNRPLYEYKIEFSTSVLDTARQVSPSGGCNDLPFDGTLLPFRITNLTTGKKVDIIHLDKGTTGEDEDPGNKDCMWERNEKLAMRWEDVMLDGEIEDAPYIYDLYIDYTFFDFFTNNVPIWSENQSYEKDMSVKYADMIWVASEYIPVGEFAPNTWLDGEDGSNMNPWIPDYGWKDGDYIILKPERWFVDGDSWVADLSLLGKSHEVTQENIEEVMVVPNPYIVHSEFNETADSRLLQFIHLPQDCRITIYTITGEVVTSFEHHDEYFSYEFWDLRTDNNQEIAPGLYIFRVESDSGKEFLGKFAVVR